MNYLMIAQYMAASALLTIAMTHLLIWFRVRDEVVHLLFALTAAAAGANALAEANMYRADSIETMCLALRWYVAASGIWAIATVCFFSVYGRVGRVGSMLTIAIVVVCAVALIVNLYSPASFLFTEVTALREIALPWGEHIWLANGTGNSLRIIADLAFFGILMVVGFGCYQLWSRRQRTRAMFFGSTVFVFMACFFVHAYFVDTGRLDSPYLSTYGFLALVFLMSYELAGEVLRMSELSLELKEKETELRAAVVEERNRIANDLHDSVTQTLFSSAAIADALPEVWRRRPDEAMRGLEDLKHLTKGALAEMRSLLLELRPAALLEKDLGQLLQQLANSAAGRTRIPIDVKIEGITRFPDDVQVALYRVAQESLNNVVKHSRAIRVWMSLVGDANSAVLTIRDNGCGFDQEDDSLAGMGIGIMRERLRSIGGRLDLESVPKAGTTVTIYWNKNVAQQGTDDHQREDNSSDDGR